MQSLGQQSDRHQDKKLATEVVAAAIMRGWQQRHQQTEGGTTSLPAKCIISRDQWAGPGKDNALTGQVKTVGEFQNKSTSRVKKRKGGHGNVSAGRWPETEVNRRGGTVPL